MQNIYDLDFVKLSISVECKDHIIRSIQMEILTDSDNKLEIEEEKIEPTSDTRFLQNQLSSYFSGCSINNKDTYKEILSRDGIQSDFSDFSRQCYAVICNTKCGQVVTYSDIAKKLNSRAYQAVGSAMRRNKYPILIPCHRVVAKDGLGGFMGKSSKLKRYKHLSKSIVGETLSSKEIPNEIKTKIALLYYEQKIAENENIM